MTRIQRRVAFLPRDSDGQRCLRWNLWSLLVVRAAMETQSSELARQAGSVRSKISYTALPATAWSLTAIPASKNNANVRIQ
jgi:hypothetical protein